MGITVHLRQRKQSKNGKVSLYLEFYKGTMTSAEGKVKAVRDYEYLDLYLVDKPKTTAEKEQNKKIQELANSIKSKRELEIKNGQYGFAPDFKVKVVFLDYFKEEAKKREDSKGNSGNWKSAQIHLTNYLNSDYHPGLTFSEIDPRLCNGFKAYLKERAKAKSGEPLSSASQNSYYAKFKACLKQAVKERVIHNNPSEGIVLPRIVSHQREYLTFEEVQQLAKTDCRYDFLKRAFLFSCLTGLRWSDIQKLSWREVQKFGDGWRIVFHQQKTKGLQYLDISQQARDLLGEVGELNDRVFVGLKYSAYMNTALAQWMLRAGITKDITFHCARHTYAVLQLNLGTDIFTLSKMLGHQEIKTTMIYSQIMDEKRIEAANRIPSIHM
jgi:integrase/recombinase XerD